MNTEKINDELYCGNWEEYVLFLEDAFKWLDEPAWCDPPESRFRKIAYWNRKFEVFNVLTTAQEFSRKLNIVYTEAKNMFEGVGITAQSAENIEERLRQLCNEDRLKLLREKYKTPEKYTQKPSLRAIDEHAESTKLETAIDIMSLSDEQKLNYVQVMIQTMDTGYMLETLLKCLTYIRNLMWDYRTDKPSEEDVIPLFKNLARNFDNLFAEAQLAYIKEVKPISCKRKDLTQEDNLHVLERLRDEHQNCAVENAKWGDKYRAYLSSDWRMMNLVIDLFHADGCERFLTHLAIIDRCEKEIEELRKIIEEREERERREKKYGLSESRMKIKNEIISYMKKADWQKGATVVNIEQVLSRALGVDCSYSYSADDERDRDAMWQLLEGGKGKRNTIVSQNLVGYFRGKEFVKGSAAVLNEKIFGDKGEESPNNINKGDQTKKDETPKGFENIIPWLDKCVAALIPQ